MHDIGPDASEEAVQLGQGYQVFQRVYLPGHVDGVGGYCFSFSDFYERTSTGRNRMNLKALSFQVVNLPTKKIERLRNGGDVDENQGLAF